MRCLLHHGTGAKKGDNMNKAKTTIVSVIILAVAAIMLIVYGATLPKTDNGEKTLTLEIKYEDKTYTYEGLTTDKGTVLEFLEEYNDYLDLSVVKEDSVYGAYIKSLKNTAINDEKGYYYTYKIDDEYALLGVSQQSLTKEDGSYVSKITFEYGTQNYDENYNTLSTTLAKGGDGSKTSTPVPAQTIVLIAVGAVVALAAVAGAVKLIVARTRKNKDEHD